MGEARGPDFHLAAKALESDEEVTDNRIPVTLLTGFLGSGKTTLLNRALRDPSLKNTAVVINEFGSIGLDHQLVAESNDTITILENGCLCCTVFGDLLGLLERMFHDREAGRIPRFDHLVIESSGLADPTPVLQAFLSDPTLARFYRVGAVLATVDAVNGPATLDEHQEAVRQVALADGLILTKLDLVGAGQAEQAQSALSARLRTLNPAAVLYRTDDGALDPPRLFHAVGLDPARGGSSTLGWLNADAYRSAGHGPHDRGRRHSHKHDDAIASFCLVRDEPSTREALQLLLSAIEQNLGPNLLRVKGLVSVAEEPHRPAVIQGAQHLLSNLTWLRRWPSEDRRTRIVFITRHIDPAELEDMVSLLDRVAARTAAARDRARNQTE